MNQTRKLFAFLLVGVLVALGVTISATPAFALTCGTTTSSWTGLVASTWDTEIYLYAGPVDETAVTAITYSGQAAVTTVALPSAQILTGTWSFDSSTDTFTWSGTDTANNTYRLTMAVQATECGSLGGVHAAAGVVTQQDVGTVGVVYTTRVL